MKFGAQKCECVEKLLLLHPFHMNCSEQTRKHDGAGTEKEE
jgi:hypothetical protein